MNDTIAMSRYTSQPGVLPVQGRVQHYEWGGQTFIPALIGESNPDGKPYAELWIGAHPGAPSIARIDGSQISLDKVLSEAPEALLGPHAASRFANRLPYLFKVLDARKMLSIQAHPSKQQAEAGFARENAQEIAPNAPHRNYKDDNHKPEVHVALTDFWMLHGFRPLSEIAGVLRSVQELTPLMPDFENRLAGALSDSQRRDLLRALYERVMTMPQDGIDNLLHPLVTRLEREDPQDKDLPDFWALRAAREFPLPEGHRDRGIVSIYLLNLVHLKPGQGTYQPAGMLHAYLEGVNMELMANSDNVLRGGLTPKHVDVVELMVTLSFTSGVPEILEGCAVSSTEWAYRTPAQEFELSRIRLVPGRIHTQASGHGPDALIVMEGTASLTSTGRTMPLKRGDIVFAPHSVAYELSATDDKSVLFRAAVPD